jgi:biopolymer transport protein ExbD
MKSDKPETRRGLTEINLTSLVDVSLTLVIIFMVSSPFVMQSGIKVATPALEKAALATAATELQAEIHLRTDGRLLLNDRVTGKDVFSDSLRNLLNSSKDKMVLISAEDEVLHDQVIAIMDAAKQCGAKQMSLVKRR